MITDAQVAEFLDSGAVTLDTPFTAGQVAAAAAAIDRLVPQPPADAAGQRRYRTSATCSYFDEELLELIQHPFLEAVAGAVLASEAVTFLQTAVLATYPQPEGTPFTYDQHIDLQYTCADLEAVPRRIVCSFFLWLSDVTATRAPLIYRPGSHRLLADHWGRQAERPETGMAGRLPRVIGIPLADLPDLDYAPARPVLARAGQVTALTTAMVHGASVNLDRQPRRALVVTFTARGVTCGLPTAQQETKAAYDRQLRRRLRGDRRHLVEEAG